MNFRRVLLIENDRDLVRRLTLQLKGDGYEVNSMANGKEGFHQAISQEYDLIIADVNLPEMTGWEICRRLGNSHTYTPIFLISSQSCEMDRVIGLELGADDYLVRPFGLREFLARVRAVLRRIDAVQSGLQSRQSESIRCGDLLVDISRHDALLRDEELGLTATEFLLLLTLASNPGRVLTRRQLLDSVWGYRYDGYEHTVNSHINRLRNKLEPNPKKPRFILTVRGVGYKFSAEVTRSKSALPSGTGKQVNRFETKVP